MDLYNYLRENKPIRETGIKYFQWLNEEYGVRELNNQIWQIIGIAKTCNSMEELRRVANEKFK